MKIYIRKILNITLRFIDTVLNRQTNFFALSYHSFGEDEWYYDVDPGALDQQLGCLEKAGYSFINAGDFEKNFNRKEYYKKSVLITVDDGYKSVLNAVPVFGKYNVKPIIFLVSDTEHINVSQTERKGPYLSKNDIVRLKKLGYSFGSHSATHEDLRKIPKKLAQSQIENSKKVLESVTGSQITNFAYPRGQYSKATVGQVISAGYRMAFTMNDGVILGSSRFEIPRIGVNRTHTLAEFKTLYSPSVILLRKLIKKYILHLQP